MPDVALAAGMGVRIEEAAHVVGRALSGSLEGFESLRNTYGISSAELAKYGAVLTRTGGIAVSSAADLAKARGALLAIIQTDFGGAVERQSETLGGVLSNLGDSITNLAAKFGQDLLPAVKTAASGLTGLVSAVGSMPDGLRQALSLGSALAAGLLALGTAATATVTAFVVVRSQLAAFAASNLAASGAASVLGAVMDKVTLAILGAGRAAVAFLASPLGLALLAISAAAGAAALAIHSYEESEKKAGQAAAEEAKQLTTSALGWKHLRDAINDTGKPFGVFVDTGRRASVVGRDLASAIRDIPAAELASGLQKAGFQLEDLAKQAEEARRKIAELIPTIQQLQRLQTLAAQLPAGADVALSGEFENLQGLFGGRTAIDPAEITNTLNLLERVRGNLQATFDAATQAKTKVEGFLKPLQEAVASARALDGYLDFSKRVGGTQALRGALTEVRTEIGKLESALASVGTDDNSLLRVLREQPGSAAADAAQQLLKLRADEVSLNKDLDRDSQERHAREMKQFEDQFRREHVLREASTREEIAHQEARLKLVEQGSDEELEAFERLRDLRKQAREEDHQAQRKDLQELVRAGVAGADSARGAGGSAAQQVADLDQVLSRLDKWKQAHSEILQQSAELRQEYEQLHASVQKQADESGKAALRENFQALQETFQRSDQGATSAAAKLQLLKKEQEATAAAARQGLISEQDARAQLLRLQDQQIAAEKQLRAERQASDAQTASLQGQLADQTIAELEARRSAGETGLEKKLEQARRDRLKLRLEDIDREKQAEIEARGDSAEAAADAEKHASLKRQAVLHDESLRMFQELASQEQARRSSLGRQEQDLREFANRIGGVSSPLMQLDQAFNDVPGLAASRFGTSNLGAGLGLGGASRLPTPAQIERRLGQQLGLPETGPRGVLAGTGLERVESAINQTITVQLLDPQGREIDSQTKTTTTLNGANSDLHFVNQRMRTDSRLGRARR